VHALRNKDHGILETSSSEDEEEEKDDLVSPGGGITSSRNKRLTSMEHSSERNSPFKSNSSPGKNLSNIKSAESLKLDL
jgi:hypothetical protein